jgi:hypothetical protein
MFLPLKKEILKIFHWVSELRCGTFVEFNEIQSTVILVTVEGCTPSYIFLLNPLKSQGVGEKNFEPVVHGIDCKWNGFFAMDS